MIDHHVKIRIPGKSFGFEEIILEKNDTCHSFFFVKQSIVQRWPTFSNSVNKSCKNTFYFQRFCNLGHLFMNVPYWLHFRLHKKSSCLEGLKIYSKEEFFHGKLAQFYEENELKWHTMWRNSVVTEKKADLTILYKMSVNLESTFFVVQSAKIDKNQKYFNSWCRKISKQFKGQNEYNCMSQTKLNTFWSYFCEKHQLFVRKNLTVLKCFSEKNRKKKEIKEKGTKLGYWQIGSI